MNYFTLLASFSQVDNHTAAIVFLCSAALVVTHIFSYIAGANVESDGDADAPIMIPFVLVMFATIASALGSLIIILINILQ
jgi:hypothetical protein